MNKTYVNLDVDQGTDYTAIFEMSRENNLPYDLTDYAITSQLRKSNYSNTSVDFTTSLTDAANGEFTIGLTHGQTANLQPSAKYLYDILIEKDSIITKIVSGIITITPSVTR